MIQKIIFLFFLFHSKSGFGIPFKRQCDDPVDTNLFAETAFLNSGTWGGSNNCYFLVKNASFMVLDEKDKRTGEEMYDLYNVNLALAQEICKRHDALLPVILTEGEQEFLNKRYGNVTHWMLLGLERVTYKNYKWGGTHHGTAYKPNVWNKITDYTTGTYTMLMTNDGRWTEFYPNRQWPKVQKFVTICHQRDYGHRTAPPPAPDDVPRAMRLDDETNGGDIISAWGPMLTMTMAIMVALSG